MGERYRTFKEKYGDKSYESVYGDTRVHDWWKGDLYNFEDEEHKAAAEEAANDPLENPIPGVKNPLEEGMSGDFGGVEDAAKKQSEQETALAWERERDRKAAQKKAEALLANQPDYTIPESVQAYVGMMTDIGNLLGGITDASGGGSPSYTAKPYTVKNSPGYGDKPPGTPAYADDMNAKIRKRGMSDSANLLASVRPTQKQTF
jgi:hypothetical protein